MGLGESLEEVDSESGSDDDEVSAATIAEVEQGLADDGYRSTDSECHEDDCDGTLWYSDNSLVCSTCWTLVDMEQQRRSVSISNPWEEFWENRPTYKNSKRRRQPGGFKEPYDWKTTDDVDGAIIDLRAEDFYR